MDRIRAKNEKVRAGLRLSLWIHLASYVMGMVIFTGINIGMGSSAVMLWPIIWWTVGAVAHGATVVIVEVATRYTDRHVAAG